MTPPASLFITGCYRSGTTLLDKLLHAHPRLSIASQPLPLLYTAFKEAFYRERGLRRRYPLEDLFLEDDYTAADFHEFLDRYVLSSIDLDRIFAAMADYVAEEWTPQLLGMRAAFQAGTFMDIYHRLDDSLAAIFPKERLDYVGSKEVLCEEYIPYLLAHGVKVILIIRDPRDMIASVNFRERDSFVGANRPVLYSIRIWRKSMAFALAYEKHPGLHWLRYEDLVTDPVRCLNQIAAWLGIPTYAMDAFNNGVFDQKGHQWRSNSSFDPQQRITPAATGRYVQCLPGAVLAFIEACCRPEMLCAGYAPSNADGFEADAISTYYDPFPDIHERFPVDYSSCAKHREEELARYEMLRGAAAPLTQDAARRWFVQERAYQRLREAVFQSEKVSDH
jgi:hypothetical protein